MLCHGRMPQTEPTTDDMNGPQRCCERVAPSHSGLVSEVGHIERGICPGWHLPHRSCSGRACVCHTTVTTEGATVKSVVLTVWEWIANFASHGSPEILAVIVVAIVGLTFGTVYVKFGSHNE